MRNKNGFTLIEVIVVTLIIATLALLVAPSFKNSALTNKMEKAKSGLVELYLAVRLYDEVHPNDQLSGVFSSEMFNKLSNDSDDQGYIYMPNASSRWEQKSLSEDAPYSLKDPDGVLNCRYIVAEDENTLVSTKCQFDKIDQEGTECYKFFINKSDPDVIKKSVDEVCDDL